MFSKRNISWKFNFKLWKKIIEYELLNMESISKAFTVLFRIYKHINKERFLNRMIGLKKIYIIKKLSLLHLNMFLLWFIFRFNKMWL